MEPETPQPPSSLEPGMILPIQLRVTGSEDGPVMVGYDEQHSVMALADPFLYAMGKVVLFRYVPRHVWEAFSASGFSDSFFQREIEAKIGPNSEGGYEFTVASDMNRR